ncbi:MAG: phosphohistidine phosphatase SixA [Bryobacteraceae bacterium]|jgi:phosphohistidine phosphatase|nr:phosphohistidine phosphatase SixA [Bryobacteraceae bacterium]
MQIYLLRHGIAEETSASGKDADRRLTPEGRKRLAAVLKKAGSAGVEPSLILTSPLVRARQTAEMAAKALKCPRAPLLSEALAPGGEPEQVWEELRLHRGEAQVLLAGHEPLFSRLAAFLLNAPTLEVDFKKGALLRVDCESLGPRPRGTLRWFLAPKLS